MVRRVGVGGVGGGGVFFNDTATTEIYTLSLHDALPILSRRLEAGKLGRAWVEVVGPELARRTRVVGPLRGGVLRIEVDSPALLSELSGFESERLHQQMRERFKRSYVRKLKFQLGTWEKSIHGRKEAGSQ